MDKKKTNVLIVDDDRDTQDTLEAILKPCCTILKADSGKKARPLIAREDVQIVLLDILLPDANGLDLLQKIKAQFPDIEVVMISGLTEISTAVKAMKMGAYHYLSKPFDLSEVRSVIEKVVAHQRDKRELLFLRSEIKHYIHSGFVIGRSKKMQEIHDLVSKVAKLPVTLLIQGESGTGKEILARHIYDTDKKSETKNQRPFVTVDLGNLPGGLIESTLFGHEKGAFTGAHRQHIGKFELANRGTLFLDEIANLRYDLQGKLLRAIQEGEIERVGGEKKIHISVRLIAATHVDLLEAVRLGTFREDLYYRLKVIPLHLPPLRERLGDLPDLIQFFLKRYNKRFNKQITEVSQSAIAVLSSYNWPGNIRELENLIERMVAVSDREMILKEHIPIEYRLGDLQKRQPEEGLLHHALEIFEQKFILKALDQGGWHRKTAAETLGIPLSTLKFKMKKLRLTHLQKHLGQHKAQKKESGELSW